MSLKHAILSLLIENETSGYDITKQFESSIGYYWSASHQQIYKTLSSMNADGWVTYQHIVQDGKPNKKFYSITAAGKDELTRWAKQPSKKQPERNEFLIRLLLADFVGVEHTLAELRRLLTQQQEMLATYREIEAEFFHPKPDQETALQHRTSFLTLSYGLKSGIKNIEWLEEAIALLEAQPST